MAETRYPYTMPPRNEGQLHVEIAALSLPGFVGLAGSGTTVECIFSDALSAPNEVILAAAVAAHSPGTDPPQSGITDGTYGDIVVSSSGTVLSVAPAAVTDPKMKNLAALSVPCRPVNSAGSRSDVGAVPGGGPGLLTYQNDDNLIDWTQGIGLPYSDGSGMYFMGDPGADRLVFWDESGGTGGVPAYLTIGSGLSIVGTTLSATGGGGGSPTYTPHTQDLGVARSSGTFDITGLSGLTADKPVSVVQTSAPITSKGDARDEPEMDHISATGYVVDATTIRVYWHAPAVVVGSYNFAFLVSA